MKRIILLLSFSAACACTTHSKPGSNIWNQMPDLSTVEYAGGDGKTVDSAIIIKNAKNERVGVSAEYEYLEKKYGKKFTTWKPVSQAVLSHNGREYDSIKIQLIPNG